jgi:phosphohistidine phosphatase SixA
VAVREIVLIVQHGEKETLPGDPGLTDTGRQQAAAAVRWISEGFSVEGLCTSPLRRAAETASEVARWTGCAVRTDERLRERMNWAGPASQPLEDFLAEWRRCSADRSYVATHRNSSAMAAERALTPSAPRRNSLRGRSVTLQPVSGFVRGGCPVAWPPPSPTPTGVHRRQATSPSHPVAIALRAAVATTESLLARPRLFHS